MRRRNTILSGVAGMIIGALLAAASFCFTYNYMQYGESWTLRHVARGYSGPDDGSVMAGFFALLFVLVVIALPASFTTAIGLFQNVEYRIVTGLLTLMTGTIFFALCISASIGVIAVLMN